MAEGLTIIVVITGIQQKSRMTGHKQKGAFQPLYQFTIWKLRVISMHPVLACR